MTAGRAPLKVPLISVGDGFVYGADAASRAGLSLSQFEKLVRRGLGPKPISGLSRVKRKSIRRGRQGQIPEVVYRESEIDRWAAARTVVRVPAPVSREVAVKVYRRTKALCGRKWWWTTDLDDAVHEAFETWLASSHHKDYPTAVMARFLTWSVYRLLVARSTANRAGVEHATLPDDEGVNSRYCYGGKSSNLSGDQEDRMIAVIDLLGRRVEPYVAPVDAMPNRPPKPTVETRPPWRVALDLLIARGWSGQQIGYALGVSDTTALQWRVGKSTPQPGIAELLVKRVHSREPDPPAMTHVEFMAYRRSLRAKGGECDARRASVRHASSGPS